MKKNQVDNFIDVSKEGMRNQARKLTKLGMKAEDAVRKVGFWTKDRLVGNKLNAEEISESIKNLSGIKDKPKLSGGNPTKVTDWENSGKDEQGNITYKPFAKLLDEDTSAKILSGKKVDRAVKSFFKPQTPWVSNTTGKTYNNKEDIYKEEQKTLDKTINKKPKMTKELLNIPTLWHPETASSEPSNGGSCQQSALTYMDWVKKYGNKEPGTRWTDGSLAQFAKMSHVHQNNEYQETLNYNPRMRKETDESLRHSGLEGSRSVGKSVHLSKRFRWTSSNPIQLLTALPGNRTYLAHWGNSVRAHSYTVTKEGNNYRIGTTDAPYRKTGTKVWMNNDYNNAKIHVDPNDLTDREKRVMEILDRYDSNVVNNTKFLEDYKSIEPRTEEEKKKIKKQIDVNTTKATN